MHSDHAQCNACQKEKERGIVLELCSSSFDQCLLVKFTARCWAASDTQCECLHFWLFSFPFFNCQFCVAKVVVIQMKISPKLAIKERTRNES
jgi:hypothetical protein